MPVYDDDPLRVGLRPVVSGTWAVKVSSIELEELEILMTGIGTGLEVAVLCNYCTRLFENAFRCSDEEEMSMPYRVKLTVEVDHAD